MIEIRCWYACLLGISVLCLGATLWTWPSPSPASPVVLTGIDVLVHDGFRPLRGKRIGLITNHTGRDRQGRSTIDLLFQAPGVRLVALFSPEHGIRGDVDRPVDSSRDERTGLPIYSLYGRIQRPTPQSLRGLDALVYDIQDLGVRFYTYVTTMGYALEEAAANGIEFIVLDRPAPLNGTAVEGDLMDPARFAFTGYYPIPVRYGMTVGEMARFHREHGARAAHLTVIPLEGWRRTMFYDETGLPWINPSPNIRNLNAALLYPGIGMFEGTNISVGRGTDRPFEQMGAPWIEAEHLAQEVTGWNLPGVRVEPVQFTPRADRFAGELCQGLRFTVTDRRALRPVDLFIRLFSAIHRQVPDKLTYERVPDMMGSDEVVKRVLRGDDPEAIAATFRERAERFTREREAFLLYP